MIDEFENSDSVEVPLIAFGTYKCDKGKLSETLLSSLKSGYRHLDCAHFYGNEIEVGKALATAMKTLQISRSELFICGKLWNTHHHDFEIACRNSLLALQLSHFDVYLMHHPYAFQRQKPEEAKCIDDLKSDTNLLPPDDKSENHVSFDTTLNPTDTYIKMQHLVSIGLTKHLGLSNFNSTQVEAILNDSRLKFRPLVLQVEITPIFQQPSLVNFCNERHIQVEAYRCLGGSANSSTFLQHIPFLSKLSSKYKKSVAQIIIRWLVQRNIVAIVKSDTHDRIVENISVGDFEIEDDDVEALIKLDENRRYVYPKLISGENGELTDEHRDLAHPHYPYNNCDF